MNQTQRAKWERTRAKGIWRFVLLFGGVLFVSQLIATYSIDYFTSPYGIRLEQMPIRALIFLVTGVLTGLALWLVGEYRYQKGSGGIPSASGK